MAKTSAQILGDALTHCSLMVYQTRTISAERDTGNTIKKGARTQKETVTCFDAGVLKAINAEKQRGARYCQQYGTKIESLAAWLVPKERIEELEEKLSEVKSKVAQLTESLASNMRHYVETYATLNPDQADEIRTLGPSAADVRDGINIMYVSIHARPEDVRDSGGLAEDMKSLHVKALHEFNMALKDAKANPQGKFFTQSIRDVLGRIAIKARTLSFLHPVLQNVSETLDDTIKNLPSTGNFDGFQAMALGSLISQLMEPSSLLRNGGFKTMEIATPEAEEVDDGHIGTPIDAATLAVDRKKTNQSNTLLAW